MCAAAVATRFLGMDIVIVSEMKKQVNDALGGASASTSAKPSAKPSASSDVRVEPTQPSVEVNEAVAVPMVCVRALTQSDQVV